MGWWRNAGLKLTDQIVGPVGGTWSTRNAGWARLNSRSITLVWFAVATRGEENVAFKGTVRLPGLPCAPIISIWLAGIVAPAVPANPAVGSAETVRVTSPGLALSVNVAET